MIPTIKSGLRFPRQTAGGESGAVLLETVIALPLLLLLLGGIMWFGQLIYDKQRLLLADRYAAWNYGNRLTQNYSDAPQRFFNQSAYDSALPPHVNESSSSNWWHEVYASVEAESAIPSWTLGALLLEGVISGRGVDLPKSTLLHGRDLSDGSAGGHTVVMQKAAPPGDKRNAPVRADDGSLGIDYGAIYAEGWPGR